MYWLNSFKSDTFTWRQGFMAGKQIRYNKVDFHYIYLHEISSHSSSFGLPIDPIQPEWYVYITEKEPMSKHSIIYCTFPYDSFRKAILAYSWFKDELKAKPKTRSNYTYGLFKK